MAGGAPRGNSNATKGKRLSKRLQDRLTERAEENNLMDILLNKALEGDMQAIKEVFDRIDGKAAQSLNIEAEINLRNADEMSDEQLADIATSGS